MTTPLYDVWSNDVTLNNVCSNDVTLNDVTFDKMSSGEKSWGRSNPFTLTLKSFIDHPSDKMLLGILGCGRSHAALGGRGTVIVLERLRVGLDRVERVLAVHLTAVVVFGRVEGLFLVHKN